MGKLAGQKHTVGYAYFLGVAYAFCKKVDRFVKWKIDGDYGGEINLASGVKSLKTGKSATSYGSHYSNSDVTFYDGSQQEANEYLTSQTGYEIAYKNTAYCVVNGFIGDNVSSVPNYSVVVERTDLGFDNYQNLNGDANPAYVLWYIFTKLAFIDEKILNKDSFLQAAAILANENFGISFVMSSPNEAKKWIEEILRTIDGVIAIDQSGLLALRLLRNNNPTYHIDESSYNALKFKRKSWDETYSSVVLNFTDRNTFSSASISATNSATKAILGYDRVFTTSFMAVSNYTNANKILSRTMKKMSYPFATLQFNLSAHMFSSLMVGDILCFSNKSLGIKNMSIRVLNLGADKDGAIMVEAVEDIFALKDVIVLGKQENLYKPIDLTIGNIEYFWAIEATIEMGSKRGILPLMVKPKGFVQYMSAKDGLSGQITQIQPFYLGRLITDLNKDKEIDNDAFFDIQEITPLWKVAGSRAGFQRLKFTCLIDNEFINFQYRHDLGGGKWRIKTLMRGLSGTQIMPHRSGALVWFASIDANDLDILPIISPNTTLYFNAGNFENKSDTKKLEFTHSLNASKPYPISNLRVEINGREIALKFRPRVRLHGANYRSADVISAGIDEGLIENDIIISWDGVELLSYEGLKSVKIKAESFKAQATQNGYIQFFLTQTGYEDGILSQTIQSERIYIGG